MPRLSLAVLLAILLAGCDASDPVDAPDPRFAGLWEGLSVEETTVVSTVDQRSTGYDLPARGAVEVTGAIETTFIYVFGLFAERGEGVLRDRRRGQLGLDGQGSRLLRLDADGRIQQYALPDIAYTVDADAATITVPEQTLVTDLGSVTIGGSLTRQGFDVPANVPTALPPKPSIDVVFDLSLAEDGTFTRTYFGSAVRGEGTWTSRGDEVTLVAAGSDPSVFTLVDGTLVQPGPTVEQPNLESAAGERGLEPGSLTSATTTYSTLLLRAD